MGWPAGAVTGRTSPVNRVMNSEASDMIDGLKEMEKINVKLSFDQVTIRSFDTFVFLPLFTFVFLPFTS
jgi:hypothetical protein